MSCQLCDLGVLGARNIRIRDVSALEEFARAAQIMKYSNAKGAKKKSEV